MPARTPKIHAIKIAVPWGYQKWGLKISPDLNAPARAQKFLLRMCLANVPGEKVTKGRASAQVNTGSALYFKDKRLLKGGQPCTSKTRTRSQLHVN